MFRLGMLERIEEMIGETPFLLQIESKPADLIDILDENQGIVHTVV